METKTTAPWDEFRKLVEKIEARSDGPKTHIVVGAGGGGDYHAAMLRAVIGSVQCAQKKEAMETDSVPEHTWLTMTAGYFPEDYMKSMRDGGKTRDEPPKIERGGLDLEKAASWMRRMKFPENKEKRGGSAQVETNQPFQVRPRAREDMKQLIETEFEGLVPEGKKLLAQLQNSSFGYRSLVQEAMAAQEVTAELTEQGLPVPAAWMFPSTEKDSDPKYQTAYQGLLSFLQNHFPSQDFEVIIVDVGGDILDKKRAGQRDVCVLETFKKLYEKEKDKLPNFRSLKVEVYGAGCDMHAPSLAEAQVELEDFIETVASSTINTGLARAFAYGVFQLNFTEDARQPNRANRCFAQALARHDLCTTDTNPTFRLPLGKWYVNDYLAKRPEVAKKPEVSKKVCEEVTTKPMKTLAQLSNCYVIELYPPTKPKTRGSTLI